jgi:N-acetyl-1-D-myo-inositol-2-amino-2-deoxy-alpha-D-glucopyranoside deacetylase
MMNNEQRTLMAVHAHPDDEVFGTGGVLAKYAAAGDRVVVVYGTRGEAGEMYDPARDPEEAKSHLGEIREQEAREACEILGVTEVCFLGYRDSGMRDTEENKNPDNFMNAPLDEATARLVAIICKTRPDVIITYDEGGGYGHPDHVMTHLVATEAFKRTQDESWGPRKLYQSARSREGFKGYAKALAELDLKIPWVREDFNFDEFGVPDADISTHIDISAFASLKKQALAVHRTQIRADFFYLSLPDDFFGRVAGTEYFIRIEPPAKPGDREDDLFGGLEDYVTAEAQEATA